MLKDTSDTTLALALGIGLTVVLVILACAIVGVKYYHKKWRQTKAKISPKDVEAMKRGDPGSVQHSTVTSLISICILVLQFGATVEHSKKFTVKIGIRWRMTVQSLGVN